MSAGRSAIDILRQQRFSPLRVVNQADSVTVKRAVTERSVKERAVKEKVRKQAEPKAPAKSVDLWMLSGFAFTIAAVIAGIAVTRVPFSYFLQPSGALIVIGGTLGATVVTTPKYALRLALQRVMELWRESGEDRAELVAEIMGCMRTARAQGLLALEPLIRRSTHTFLKEALTLALDVNKAELETAVETKIRLGERRGEAAVQAIEAAAGFAPTIGVFGTVVGLIEALRSFSDLSTVAGAVGMAFASTLYGIALANLLLWPLAHRVRAAVNAATESQELVLEGMICILDGVHPTLASERLRAFLVNPSQQIAGNHPLA